MASLDSAYLRLDRGREHLKELKILHDQVCSAQAKGTVAEMQPEVTVKPGETLHFGTVYHGNAPIPDRCRILVGDAAGDFRKALDYVVSQLYILAGLKGRTQLPIEGSPEGFRHPRNDFIRKLPAHQIA